MMHRLLYIFCFTNLIISDYIMYTPPYLAFLKYIAFVCSIPFHLENWFFSVLVLIFLENLAYKANNK